MNWKLLVFLEACLLAGLQTAKAGPGGARRPTVRMFGNLTSELKTTASRFIAEESAYSLGISISALATDDTGAFSTTFGDHTVEEGTSQLVPSPSTLVYKPTKPVTESTPISQSTQKGVYAEPTTIQSGFLSLAPPAPSSDKTWYPSHTPVHHHESSSSRVPVNDASYVISTATPPDTTFIASLAIGRTQSLQETSLVVQRTQSTQESLAALEWIRSTEKASAAPEWTQLTALESTQSRQKTSTAWVPTQLTQETSTALESTQPTQKMSLASDHTQMFLETHSALLTSGNEASDSLVQSGQGTLNGSTPTKPRTYEFSYSTSSPSPSYARYTLQSTPVTVIPTQQPFPTKIITAVGEIATDEAAKEFPSSLPRAILSGSGESSNPPAYATLIQVGFLFPLNYFFVSQNLDAAGQIFRILPHILSQVGAPIGSFQVVRLVPYDSRETLGYVATLAMVYYPTILVDKLQRDIYAPNSRLYTAGDDLQRNLSALINPSIEIKGAVGDSDCASETCPPTQREAGDGDLNKLNSSKDQGLTVGMVIGGTGVSGFVGFGVFYLARRYKRRKAHDCETECKRCNEHASVGTRYRISRPIAVSNSLGWGQ
jgi:hypothetical protein